jgi:N-acetylneuraminate synthase
MYPTPNEKLHFNQIELMRNRYPGVTIGFSTHEDPSNFTAVQLAFAKGARLFEKHVGVAADTIQLNAYSASPEQVEQWIVAYKSAAAACGENSERVIEEAEKSDLRSLMRGVYARKDIPCGMPITRNDIFFAMPLLEDQLTSGRFREGVAADRFYRANEALSTSIVPQRLTKREVIASAIHTVKGMLHMAKIPIGHDFLVELSHHNGLGQFHRVGCTIIECINREYAKKIIVQFAGQWNPVHYHKRKDETFQVISGALIVEIEGQRKVLYPGDTLWVPQGVWHGFGTEQGVIFEEISTQSFNDDSFYIDRMIAQMPRSERKTRLQNWGKHQFDDMTEEVEIV